MISDDRVADIVGFNKVYFNLCRQIDEAVLEAGYSITEKDVLFEISRTKQCTANILINQLHIDRSYMSRMISKFEKRGLIEKKKSSTDSRIYYIHLTGFGRDEFNRLSDIQSRQIRNIFENIDDTAQEDIVCAMIKIRNVLSDANDVIRIRPYISSDIEYVISRHKTLYYAERHLSDVFFSYVDDIVYRFVQNYDERTDCLNILECNGAPAGSIAVVNAGDNVAQLRFFMLEPEMRRRGYGNKLMELALGFCRQHGYRKVFLLTITAQVVARHVYETHGFHKVSSRDKSEWGENVVEEQWEKNLIL